MDEVPACIDCGRRGRFIFVRDSDGKATPRCGTHAYPLLSRGTPPGYTVHIAKRYYNPPVSTPLEA